MNAITRTRRATATSEIPLMHLVLGAARRVINRQNWREFALARSRRTANALRGAAACVSGYVARSKVGPSWILSGSLPGGEPVPSLRLRLAPVHTLPAVLSGAEFTIEVLAPALVSRKRLEKLGRKIDVSIDWGSGG